MENDGSSAHDMYVLGERLKDGGTESEFKCVKMSTGAANELSRRVGKRVFQVGGQEFYYMGMSNQPMSSAGLRPWSQTT